ncbi:5'-3' exoribonuclease 2, isoform CRA_e [Mus musculus]|nr:5'-3' exoribonuclease 2, isoform CRA_e [Mus musculus]
MIQNQNAAFQPNQYQMLGGPGGYPPRRDDHRGGRQGYPREGRKYPLPPPSGRYSWN